MHRPHPGLIRSVGSGTSPARAIGLALCLTAALAAPASGEEWAIIGARYQAMGGAGVATVDDSLASYWNPGALAFAKDYDVHLPVGFQASAEGGVLGDIDDVARFVQDNDFDRILDKIRTGTTLNPAELRAALDLTIDQLSDLAQEEAGFQGSVEAALTGRYQRFALSGLGLGYYGVDPVFDFSQLSLAGASGADGALRAVVGAGQDRSAQLSSAGLSLAGQISDIFTAYSNPAKALPRAQELVYQAERAGIDTSSAEVRKLARQIARATVRGDGDLSLNDSGAFVTGLVTQQVGIAYGHPFFDRIGVGANVKYIHGISYFNFERYDAVNSVGDVISQVTDRDRQRHDDDFGIDLGLLVKPVDWLRLGLVGRNLNEPSFDVDVPDALKALPDHPADHYTLERQLRAGVAVDVLPIWTLAVDADLLENSSAALQHFHSRLVSAGTELRLQLGVVGLALRGGAYANVADGANNAIALTGGLGLRVWHLELDLAVGGSPDTEPVDVNGNAQDVPSRTNMAASLRFAKQF